MTPPIFRFFLKPTASAWYYVNSNGAVAISATPVQILNVPIGWNDIKLTWQRSEKWWGLMRSFSTPLAFIKDAAKILRTVFTAAGIEGKATLGIEKLQTYSLLYAPFYEGEIDFSNHVDTDTQVQENIMESGLAELLRKRDNIPYRIPISGSDVTTLENDGIVLGQFEIMSFDVSDGLPGSRGYTTGTQFTPKMAIFSTENPLGSDLKEHGSTPSTGTSLIVPNFFFYTASAKGTARFKVKGTAQMGVYTSTQGKGFTVKILQKRGSTETLHEIYSRFEYFDGYVMNFDTSLSIQVEVGDKLYMIAGKYALLSGGVFSWAGQDMDWIQFDGTLSIEYPHRNTPYNVDGLRYYQVFEKLIATLTDGQYTGLSTFLADPSKVAVGNRPYHTLVTCGDAIRGLTGSGLKITLRDLLQDAWSRWGLTIGVVNGQARLEPLGYFLQDTLIAHLGDLKDVKLRPATEFMGNSLKIGYQNQNYGELYGKDEFNASQTYSLPVTRVQKELDFVSPWRADMYGIETTSRNLSGKDKQDASSDNDTFLIEIDYKYMIGKWVPYRPQTPGNVFGLQSPVSAYNLMLSPARSLKRLAGILRSMHYPVNGAVRWQVSDKNPDLVSYFDGFHQEAGTYLTMDALGGNLLMKPYWFESDTAIPDGIISAIQNNPNGYFTFNWRGHLWKGFGWRIDVKPALHEKQSVMLLAHPSTDISLAIQ